MRLKTKKRPSNGKPSLFCQDQSGLLPLVAPIYYGAGQCLVSAKQASRFSILRKDNFNYYSRDGLNQTLLHVEKKLSNLYGISNARLVNSGMTAILVAILVSIKPSSRIFVCSGAFIDTQLLALNHFKQMGYETKIFDLTGDGRCALKDLHPEDIIIVESITNPLCVKINLAAFQNLVSKNNCTLIVDNTLASTISWKIKPSRNTFVVESLTKYHLMNAGTGGAIYFSSYYKHAVHEVIKLFGLCMGPEIAARVEQGLHTLPFRIEKQNANACVLVNLLQTKAPKKLMKLFTLISSSEGVAPFVVLKFKTTKLAKKTIDNFSMILPSPSFGGTISMVSPANFHVNAKVKHLLDRAGADARVIRIFIGMENPLEIFNDLMDSVEKAFLDR
ncbi:MAG: PLP-dependent transferase [Bdellovibrio sp.]|nr:PLP-dependent transferase [Bdellovibrio sp.]